VGVETIAGAQIFVEEDATAEFRAVIIALEIAGMNDAAEAGLGKSFSLKSTVQVKPVKNWLASPDVPIEVPRCTRGCSSCCCQPTAVSWLKGSKRAVISGKTPSSLEWPDCTEAEAPKRNSSNICSPAFAEPAIVGMPTTTATDAIANKRRATLPKSILICCPYDSVSPSGMTKS
jgi:hypothetical protein